MNTKYFILFYYSIKMCTNVNHKDLITVHHEMMHVQYFLNYRHQPKVFRDGANSGKNIFLFHEISSSVGSCRYGNYFLYSLPHSDKLLNNFNKTVVDALHAI